MRSADGQLRVPALPPRFVSRPRLLAALDKAVDRPLTLVSAGPGSGKSVLLSEWARLRPDRIAWISLEPADNEPVRFWTAVGSALLAAGWPAPDVGIDAGTPAVLHACCETADDKPVVLVLDDAHVLTDPAILADLDSCIANLASVLRFVVAARHDPLFALAGQRATGGVAELRAADLAMTRDESDAVIAAHGVRLRAPDLEMLSARTEGWAAGVRLLAMRLETTDRPSEFVAEFALDQGSVGEYLIDEVLNRQPPEVRRLLIETSFVHEITGSLAAAITGIPQAEQMLAELSRTNSFVLSVEPGGATYRYHHLFAEILRYLLRREPGAQRAELSVRAARWYAAAGDLSEALRQAVESDDVGFAVHTLAFGGFAQVLVDRIDLRWLDGESLLAASAADPVEADSALAAAAGVLAYGGRHEQAKALLERLSDDTARPAEVSLTIALTELLVARAQRDIPSADECAARIRARQPGRGVLAASRLEQAMTHFYGREHSGVAALLRSAAADAGAAQAPSLELECAAQLAHVSAFWGDHQSSVSGEDRAHRVARRYPQLPTPPALLVAAAERMLALANVPAAVDAARRAATLAIEDRDSDLRAEITMLQTFIRVTTGQYAGARPGGAPARSGEGLMADYQVAFEATIETALGRPNAAVRLLKSHEAADPDAAPSGITQLALGWAHLARGAFDDAESALRPVLGDPIETANRLLVVEALVADAEIVAARGADDDRAVESLLRAIELADGEYFLPFVRLPDRLAELRSRHLSLTEVWPVTPEANIDITDIVIDEDTAAELAEALTERERAVLRWLATTMSTTEIAEELCLSVNTVKSHIAAIYRKLATARRRDAVLRARELELL